jgi:putative flavoprotein involved in K+ transport
VGHAWRRRWDSLRLVTPARYDGLPGMRFPGPTRYYPSRDEMADYLEAYAARFELPVRANTRIDDLSCEDGRYLLSMGGEPIPADRVVVAVGPLQR